ncbi:hypothetical protein B0J12DRAFT_733513 [Macrophomina phaseolina]|uniref:Uncharacterized protein n=1 Tax=Macrophomina phaseolina TaxID=35725 RepID=A0ABQ8FRE0_9PEZI|nr:hypothetical protein B0J12DRAFT_733513 [Macrophomina phaseolina]
MDTLLSQYAILERIQYLLEPQDYINLLRSRNKDYRHKADRTDIKYCLNPYLVGNVQGYNDAYDIVLVIAFDDLRSYQQALLDTLNGLVGNIHEEIKESVRDRVVSLLPDAQRPHMSIVRLYLEPQVSDLDSLSFFKEQGSPKPTQTAYDSTPAVFVCGHAAEPLNCPLQPLSIFSSRTTSAVLLAASDNPTFISVRKCHICLSSEEKVENFQLSKDGIGMGGNTALSSEYSVVK